MKKEFIQYTVALIVTLALGFWASMPESSKDPSRVAVLSISPSQIGSIDFTSPEIKVHISLNTQKKWWIETEKAGVKDGFLASAKIQDALSQLNPLEAVRVVGTVKDEGLAEYGLQDAKKSIEIRDKAGAVVLALTIGKQAFGSSNIFVKEGRDQKVLLLSGEFIGDIEKPDTKLYERTITSVVFDEVQRASMVQGPKVLKLLHSKRDDKGALIWTKDDTAGNTVASAKSWFERLDRVRIVSYAKAEEIQVLDKEPVLFEVNFEGSPSTTDHLVFVKRAGAPTAQGPVTEYFVRSNFLGTWAKVASTRLEPIEKDLPAVLGE